MKTKIFALIMAILCLTMLFAACDKDTCETHVDVNKDAKCDVCEAAIECKEHVDANTDAKCDVCGKDVVCDVHKDADGDKVCDVCAATITACEHKDDDANKVCDLCDGAIVTITQLQKPEAAERVDMVVNQIPTDAKLEDYINTKLPTVSFKDAEKLNYGEMVDEGIFVLYDEATGKTTYTVTDENLKVRFTKTVTDAANTTFDLTFDAPYFTATTVTETVEPEYKKVVREYLAIDGTELTTLTWESSAEDIWVNEDGVSEYEFFYAESVYAGSEYWGVKLDGTLYVFDNELALVHKTAPELFVPRPEFTYENDEIGIVEVYGDETYTYYVYDLNEWIKCTAKFSYPEYEANHIVLADGNILVQEFVYLPNNAITYDVNEYGYKGDIVYTLIDSKTGEKTNVEFGYYIDFSAYLEEIDALLVEDKDINVLKVYPIVNDNVDRSAPMILLVNSKLEILFDYGAVFGTASDVVLLDDNRFLVTVTYNNGQYRKEIVNEKGERVAYVPYELEEEDFYGDYLTYDGKYYNLEMKLMFDEAAYEKENQVEVWSTTKCANYLVVEVHAEVGENTVYTTYIVTADGKMTEVVKPEDGSYGMRYEDFGYAIVFSADGETPAYVELYDLTGKKILTINECALNDIDTLDDGTVVVSGNGGKFWVLK